MSEDSGWRYNHKTNSYFNIDWIAEDERIKELQISKNENIRKQLNSQNSNLSPAELHNIQESIEYFKEFENLSIPKDLDFENPKEVLKVSNELAKAYANSNADVSCYHTAGILAALFDKAKQKYHCYAGTCYPTREQMKDAEGGCNHMWIVHNNKIYETYPQHNDRVSQYYHKPIIEILFN